MTEKKEKEKDSVDEEGEKTYLGRTTRRWVEILVFYLIYYTCLFLFWYGVYSVFMIFIDKEKPTLKPGDARIGAHPAITVMPKQDEDHLSSSFYRLALDFPHSGASVGNIRETGNKGYAARMRQYLDILEASGRNYELAINCTEWDKKAKKWKGKPAYAKSISKETITVEKDRWCHLDPKEVIQECSEFPFGYGYVYQPISNETTKSDSKKEGGDPNPVSKMTSKEDYMGYARSEMAGYIKTISPCFIIKVNRLFGFEFKKFDLDKVEKMDDWPKDLKGKIEEHWKEQGLEKDAEEKHEMYIDCKGVYPEDIEALTGTTKVVRCVPDKENGGKCEMVEVPKVEYFPKHQGISAKYFPFNNKMNKGNPLVAVRFNALQAGQLINVRCKAFYPGSDSSEAHEDDPNLGTVRFQLYLEDDKDFLF